MKFRVEPDKAANAFQVVIKGDDSPNGTPGAEIGCVEGFDDMKAAHSFVRDFLTDLFTKRWAMDTAAKGPNAGPPKQ